MTRLRVLGSVDVAPAPGAMEVVRPAGLAPRQRRLLAALAARPNTVLSTDALADAVWGSQPPADLTGALHTLVSRLRAVLHERAEGEAGPQLVTQPPGYVLRVGRDDLDASAFEALVESGRNLLAGDPAAAAEMLDRALALWRGRAFAEFADEEFARAEATRLEELRTGAIEDAIEARLAAGDLVDAVGRAESLAVEQPLRERPRAQLMRAYSRQGRPADALAVFAGYRTLLADELGLEPSTALQELQAAVLRGEPAGPSTSVAVPPQVRQQSEPPSRDAGNLARHVGRSPAILGREDALHEVDRLVQPGALLTVVGPGGVGKTTLALCAAQRAAQRFPDGVWLCDLSALSRQANVPFLVTTTLDLAPREGMATTERLLEFLSDRCLLLVLDNCEHLLAAVAELATAVHHGCPRVGILATSRAPLDVQGEQLYPLAPLAVPPPDADPAEVARAPAVRLFADRAAARGRELTVDETSAADVAEVCRRLDGLPLALELAANRTRSMSVADLAGRLSWRFRLLRGGPVGGPGRHRTLRAVVDWSYDLLDADQQRVFEVLSVFAGGFSLADAERLVCAVALPRGSAADPSSLGGPMDPERAAEIVLSLADRSMLAVEPLAGGYAMLETIRAYGRERLAQRPYAEQVRRVHADLYTDLVATSRGQLFGPQHYAAAELIRSRFDELRAAFGWAAEHDLELAANLVGSLLPYLEQRMSAEVGHWADRVLAMVEADSAADPLTPVGLAAVQAVAASAARFSGALDRARGLAERGLEGLAGGHDGGAEGDGGPTLVVDSGAPGGGSTVSWAAATECYLRYLMAEISQFAGRLDETQTLTDEVMRVAADFGLDAYQQLAEMGRCLVTAYVGRPLEAAEQARGLRERAAAQGQLLVEAWSTYAHGECLLDVDPAAATPLLDAALARARELDDRYLLGVTLVSVASLRCRHGDPMEAVPVFREAVEHWHRAGNWTHQWTTLRNVAHLFGRLDRAEQAAVLSGALGNRSTSVAATGDDARRLQELRSDVVARLGERAAATAIANGARMTDEEVLAFVRSALDAVPPPG